MTNYGHQLSINEVECPVCGTLHTGEFDEDGLLEVHGLTGCARADCPTVLCPGGCEHFAWVCESCNQRFCHLHQSIPVDGRPWCVECREAADAAENECRCWQVDVDLFDNSDCPAHSGRRTYAPVAAPTAAELSEDVPF
jgi:hypothetical protein